MGFELAPKTKDSPVIEEQIQQAVSSLYQGNFWLSVGFVVIIGLLVFWSAQKVAKSTGHKRVINGLLTAAIPIFLSVLFIFLVIFDFLPIVDIWY